MAKAETIETRAPVNVAALREALEDISENLSTRIELRRGNRVTMPVGEAKCLVGYARAALATRPRNCDVGTVQEQEVRHANFCAAHYKANDVDAQCFGCPANTKEETACEFVWAQMPYEGKEKSNEQHQ